MLVSKEKVFPYWAGLEEFEEEKNTMGFDKEKVQFSDEELAVGADFQVVIDAVKDGLGPEDLHAIDELKSVVGYIVGADGNVHVVAERLVGLASMLIRNNLDEFLPGTDTENDSE